MNIHISNCLRNPEPLAAAMNLHLKSLNCCQQSTIRPSQRLGEDKYGHHEYMGSHVDKMEERLRSAFPGQSEDFYKYGKWGGGATSSDAFLN